MHTLCLTNGRILAPHGDADSLHFCGEVIADAGAATATRAYDLEGDFLVPGLIELHTDNLEKHFVPRAGVNWPAGLSSIAAHDVHMIGAGVTTVFDAITVGEPADRSCRNELLSASLNAIASAAGRNLLRAEHFVHLRCELAGDDLVERLSPCMENKRLRLLSIMDHTPGQRQWRDLDKYKTYHSLHGATEEEFAERLDMLKAKQMKNAPGNLKTVVDICRALALPLASHDDTTAEHVRENAGYGTDISEFPTTMEAAREAKRHGLSVIMGAPNIVRGGSHSGNVSAVDLAQQGLLDILSSDYMPASLLHAAFLLPELTGVSLREAMETVTINPAKVVGLDDRGELTPGKRADAVQVRLVDGIPVVRAVWRSGLRVL
ncbi:MAG: alpha-D-ribose 1-methylphosphonate 5-triphosphate diphosphatase [Deltaproteobacteria bacterium]|jgi:alpha-D-ribose 1-methylphosphonate 5-triphosphate diphosphatase|nr:alpha-D-ribose 1-methylphosphonate 5-triphosphate diphosphatase [Deltaproteobacteria bacterium]